VTEKKSRPAGGGSPIDSGSSLVELSTTAAHAYLRRDWIPVQLHGIRADGVSCTCAKGAACGKDGRNAGKHPVSTGWASAPAPSGADIQAMFDERPYAHNVGIRTGEVSGLFVLDVDPDNGGDATLAALVAERGPLPRTFVVRTGSGGCHIYFRQPDFHVSNSAGRLGRGLDVRGEGGQVVAPPSRSAKGDYTVEVDAPVAAAPAWLLDLLRPRVEQSAPPPDPFETPSNGYVAAGVQGELARLDAMRDAATPDGNGYGGEPWDATTFAVACNLVELAHSGAGYPVTQAHADLLDRAPRDGGFTDRDIEAKWTSALAKIGDKARTVPPKAEPAPSAAPASGQRSLTLTPASSITVRPVRWLWDLRIALGTLALLGGREGIGKSTVGYWLAAEITRGRLPGAHMGAPKGVIVAATEDDWAFTVVPRLMAAGADLDRVYRVDVTTPEGVDTAVCLPRDLPALEASVREVDAALILLDPLMSRLDSAIDTHKDADVRLALEPLTALAGRTGAALLGLIHVNKSHSTDPLNLLMASRAFGAVSRSVLFLMKDPDDEATRLLGTPKNNLGRTDLPTLTLRIEGTKVADTDEGPVWTGRVVWGANRDQSISEVLESSGETADTRSAVGEAAEWLRDYLVSVGGCSESAAVKDEGKRAGHSPDALKRARVRIKVTSESTGFPRRTYWRLQSEQPSGSSLGESAPTALTAPTALSGTPVGAVGAVSAVGGPPREAAPTVCLSCGGRLLLRRPGREHCEKCRLAEVAS